MALLTDVVYLIGGNKGYLCLSLLLLYVIVTGAQTILTWYKLRQFKGPFWAAFSKWWLVKHQVGRTRFHLEAYEVCKKYGSIARIGPEQLITSDPDIIKRMLAARSPYHRSDWYVAMRFDPARDNIESTRDVERHAFLRSKMAPGYSGKETEGLEQTVDQTVLALIDLLDTKYISTESEYRPMDLGRKIMYFTVDTITALSHGKAFGCLATNSDMHDYIQITEAILPPAVMITIYPWLNWVLQLSIVKPILPSEADPVGVGKVKAITKQVVAERFGPDKKIKRDMMGSFVKHGMSQEEVESETIVQLLAGSDTSATALRSTLLYVLSNPRIATKLRAEISSAASLSWPVVSDAEARKLPYLQAVIKEGLRIWPPIASLLSKEVPAGGDVLDGRFVPGGTRIGWCSWGMCRNPDTFGDDPDVFRPERWLDQQQAPERLKKMEDTLGMVFSYGRHACLGKNIALMELNKVLVEFVRRFDFDIVDPQRPWNCKCFGLFQQKEMWTTVRRREVL